MTDTDAFLSERRRARRFFNRMSPLYPIVERHLFPQYRDVLDWLALPPEFGVLDLATGTGLLAWAFAERGHAVAGLDFAERLLTRARRRFPGVDFRNLDLRHLDEIATGSYDLVSMGYFLHGLSPEFRRFVLRETAGIARCHVLIFDYGCDGGWFIRLIEWVEGPNYPLFIAEDRERELGEAGLRIDREGARVGLRQLLALLTAPSRDRWLGDGSGLQAAPPSPSFRSCLKTPRQVLFSGLDVRQRPMSVKFSEDVVPLTDLKVNPGRVVRHATDAHRPVLLTSRGRGVAVVQSVSDFEKAEEERAFMRAVVEGLADLEEGREVSLAEAKARFGLK